MSDLTKFMHSYRGVFGVPEESSEREEHFKFMDSQFALVGITEKFEESLVLMMEKMCVPMSYLTSVKKKVLMERYKVSEYVTQGQSSQILFRS